MQRARGSSGALALLLVLVAGACSNGAQPSSTPSDAPATASPDAATASPPADPSAATTPGASPLPGAVLVPGTHAALVPPEGFTASATFVGFEHESGASIVIAELPGPYDEIVPGLTDEGFAGQGVTVTARTELT
ncbi:MAG TPA: hypothetical protein VFX65_11720, partial [Candidatus Limnocylindrales bacterium]|nr:hypothetical protein [Candidatus Limnocylindrales bacterium]